MKLISKSHAASPSPSAAASAPEPAFGELLSPSQLSLRLGISRRTLSKWTRENLLPMVKIGKVCRFDYAKVCAVLVRHEVPAAADADAGGRTQNDGSSKAAPAATPAPSETPSPKPARPPLSQFILTGEQLAQMTPEEVRRISGTHRRPVWRHHYDPYAGPPVSQTVKEALARAAKAPPGFIPEVEMLTPEELDQREEEIRNGPPRPSSRSQARLLKATRKR